MQHTARFWVLINDCPVKLSMRPGDTLAHVSGGRTDEGYSWTAETWEFDGQGVKSETTINACDCDGRLDSRYDAYCPAFLLAGGCELDGVTFPLWQDRKASQRDYSAEAMNY